MSNGKTTESERKSESEDNQWHRWRGNVESKVMGEPEGMAPEKDVNGVTDTITVGGAVRSEIGSIVGIAVQREIGSKRKMIALSPSMEPPEIEQTPT